MSLNPASMLYGTLLLTGTGLVNQLLAFVYRIALSRLIGAQVMGLYQLIMPVYAVLQSISAIGLTAAVSTLTSRYHALDNHRAAVEILHRALFWLVVLLALPAVVVVALSDPISVYLLGDARTQLGLVLLLPCILLTGVENLHKHAFYGIGVIRPPAFTEIAEQLVRTVAVLGLLLLFLPQNPERTVAIIVIGMVLCEVFSSTTLTLLYRQYRKAQGSLTGTGLPSSQRNREIATIAFPIACTALLGNLMGSVCAILIPQKLVEGGMAAEAAISAFGVLFGMTVPLLSLPTAFIGALGLVLVPKLAQSVALGQLDRMRHRISKALLATSVLILPAMAFLMVLGPSWGAILFKEPTVGDYLLPLAVGVALGCYQSVLSCSLNGIGRQSTAARIALLCGGLELIMVYCTVGRPGVGLMGYVLATLVTALLGVLLSLIALWRYAKLKPQLFQWVTAPGLAALLTGLVVNLLFHVLVDAGLSPLWAGLPCFGFGGFLYLITLHAQGVHLRTLFNLKSQH